jgi:hypothetical protein
MVHRIRRYSVLLGVIGLVACQEGFSPDPQNQLQFAKARTATSTTLRTDGTTTTQPVLASCPRAGYDSTAVAIGTGGGTIALGKHRLVIPAGALSSTVTISMVIPGDSTASARFHPDGLVFNAFKPATLTLSYKGCKTGTTPSVVYIDETFNLLAWLSTLFLDQTNGSVSSFVGHFSRYAVAW